MVKVCLYSQHSTHLLRRYNMQIPCPKKNMQIYSTLPSNRSITMFFIWFECLQTQFICLSITIVHPLDIILHDADPWPVVFMFQSLGSPALKRLRKARFWLEWACLQVQQSCFWPFSGDLVLLLANVICRRTQLQLILEIQKASVFLVCWIFAVFFLISVLFNSGITHYRSIFKEHRSFSARQKPCINQATAEGKATHGLSLTRKQEI